MIRLESVIKKENERKKNYLRKYKESVSREKAILDEIQRLRMDKMFPSVVNDGMPHAGDCGDLSDYMVLMDRQIENLKRERLEKMKIYTDIENRIRAMDEETEKEILRLKYIMGVSFEEIAVKLNYSYRHVTRLHGDALQNFIL